MRLFILLIVCLAYLLRVSSTHDPRMTFTSKEMPFKSFRLSVGDSTHIQLLQSQEDIVTVAAQKHLYSVDFQRQNPGESQQTRCIDSDSTSSDCQYNITVLQKRREANQLLLCGNNGKETRCCNMNMSEPSSLCSPSEDFASITLNTKEGELSLLIDSPGAEELYITHSGSEDSVGIHRFGKNRVGPVNNGKEQRYVSLVVRNGGEQQQHDKLYAFYKEKNTDHSMDSDMWVPYVAQVCMADCGGPKSNLQFVWTSQLSAKLFCGDPDRRQDFSELLDVATLHADRWQDTRVYALFRNEWGMSAVCFYTIADIDRIFTTSNFKGHAGDIPTPRPGMCDGDSKKLPHEVLRVVEKNSEMEDRVMPLNNSAPLFVSHHHYTHIRVDSIQSKNNSRHTVLFLSLQSGRVHKVLESGSQAFFITEYQPFNHRAHILDMILHPSSPSVSQRKLYVASGSDVVQVDMGSCSQYGDTCQDCILARDPYCGWNGTHCVPSTHETLQDVEKGNHHVCKFLVKEHSASKVHRSPSDRKEEAAGSITLPLRSKHFLQCPAVSKHAKYSWKHYGKTTPCTPVEQQCLFLIDSMSPEDMGDYKCVSEEMGYIKTLAQYQLQVESRAAGQASCPLAWVCLMVVVVMKTVLC